MKTNQALLFSSSPKSRTIMIVDDEEMICRTLSQVLSDEGYNTLTASSGNQAIELLKTVSPDVIFLDVWMPGLDGLETLDLIKRDYPDIQVIVISGHATIASALEATKLGAMDFVEKPLDLQTIVEAVERVLTKRDLTLESSKTRSLIDFSKHLGCLSEGLKGSNLKQRTLKRSLVLYGQGLHSGKKSGLVLEPLSLNSGIHFSNIGGQGGVPSFVDYVDTTAFATTIRSSASRVSTIEHLLSALHAYRISNLLVKCNEEVPILDGSSIQFCNEIENVGIEEQGGDWFEIAPEREFTWTNPNSKDSKEKITISPSDTLEINYTLDYPAPVGREEFSFRFSSFLDYKREIAPARTFGFLKDIERLQRVGLAAGGRLDNFILISNEGVVNTELRFKNELSRHKILDIIGDLFLIGRPLRAKISAQMTGHSDNIALLRMIREEVLKS